jgi:hypothetical protein
MSDILVIDLDQIGEDFEDIKLFDIIYLVANMSEKDAWVFSAVDDLEYDLLNEFEVDIGDERCFAVLDFETGDLSKIDIKITFEQEIVEKKKIEITKS